MERDYGKSKQTKAQEEAAKEIARLTRELTNAIAVIAQKQQVIQDMRDANSNSHRSLIYNAERLSQLAQESTSVSMRLAMGAVGADMRRAAADAEDARKKSFT